MFGHIAADLNEGNMSITKEKKKRLFLSVSLNFFFKQTSMSTAILLEKGSND